MTCPFTKSILLVVFSRLLLGPFIFASVWVSCIGTFLIDWVDGEIFKHSGWTHAAYINIDKALDFYYYFFVLAYIIFNNVPQRNLFIVLFLIRAGGQLAFFWSKKEEFFFFFPNIYEIFFYFYLLTLKIPALAKFMNFPRVIYPLVVITLLVLLREYLLHVRKANLSWMLLGKTTYWVDKR